ncbi:MAG TPA: LON peptidase substrate-binding domain-containing protein [Burkholderiales bacterium]|nr:LON peptidase substrate-binding domain-containing protein [Burkholderiales bacterium]
MSAPELADLALFPLQTVLFPGGRLPLRLFEQRYLDMAKTCLREDAPFGVCLIREGAEVGAPAEPVEVGCLARIDAWDMAQLGVLQIVALGGRRFRILERRVQKDGLARARVALLDEEVDSSLAADDLCARILRRALESGGEGLFEPPARYESAAWVSARLAELLPLSLESKQRLLELDAALDRIEILRRLVRPTAA